MAAPVLTKDRTLINVSAMPGDWDTCSDPTASRDIVKFRRSADSPQEALGGRITYENVTLTRIWAEARDAAILRQFKSNPDYFNGSTLSLTGLGTDGVAMGSPDTYVGSVESVSRTGSDANSSDQSKLTVIFAIASGA